MSSPENVDPIDAGLSESPEEQQGPKKTRYGRIIVRKGDLPGENEVPKIRKKKAKKEENIKVKRKYTKRRDRSSEHNEEEDTVKVVKMVRPAKEAKTVEVPKEVKVEEDSEEYEEAEPEKEKESDGEDFTGRQVRVYRKGKPVTLPVPNPLPIIFNDKQPCEVCGELMEPYKLDKHKLDNHPQHAPFECLSCRVRSFFDYWDLKEHYKVCSDGRIARESNGPRAHIPETKNVIESPWCIHLYQPVECPFCRIYLATFFDLDIHLNAHGLASMDSKFGCDGCRATFVSVEALKRHLFIQNNTITQRRKCFNTGRVLNRREIEKLKERFSDADRKDCARKYNYATYALAAPKILECVQEAICAYCHKPTKAYAHLKKDLSNLSNYGLQCSEETGKAIMEKIAKAREENGRVRLCRHHFQWRNWTTKDDEIGQTKEEQKEKLAQKLIRRRNDEVIVNAKKNGISVPKDTRGKDPMPSGMINHCYSNGVQSREIKVEEVEDALVEELFKKKVIKDEEPDWDEGNGRGRTEEEEMEAEFDIIDISEDEEAPGGTGVAPSFMDQNELEEKVSASMKISYKCPVCEKSYPTMADLHSHQQDHPKSRLLYLCADCPNQSFLNPDDVYKHFDEKKKSAVASFYSYKVIVQEESPTNDK